LTRASHFKTDVIINNMPGRMPAKNFRAVLFDISIAAAFYAGGR
jgi:hypothetical protein